MTLDLFSRKKQEIRERYGERVPPNQRVVKEDEWPVLHYGAIPRVEAEGFTFRAWGLVEEEVEWDWDELNAIAQADFHNDIHCVTGWSKMDNDWRGVPVQEVLSRMRFKPEATAVMVHSFGGYTTNLLMTDLDRPANLLAHTHNGAPIAREHGGPLRLVVPHLYFWKSAKWVRGFEFISKDAPGFWEMYGYHLRGDPWKEERYS